MNAVDFLLVGIPMLTGGILLARWVRWALNKRLPQRFPEAYRVRHSRFMSWLIRKRIVRMPGLHLVDPVPPFLCGEIAGLAVLLLGYFLERTPGVAFRILPIACLVGFGLAWVALLSSSRKALDSVRTDLPIACFLLSLLLESGMGTSSALQETAASIPRGPLSAELGEMVRARSLGVSRTESIRRSGERIPLEDYRLFLNHIHQGERLGVGLSKSLRGLSARMLESREHRAETIAQQAAVKLLFPLICFIFPAVFLIILSPVILGLLSFRQG